jgi:hypothetical protein
MPTQLQLRRGNTAQTAVFTGALAEITVDTTRQTLIIHDGTTAGGTPLSTLSFAQAAYDAANAAGSSATVTAAFLQANSAFVKANSAYGSQNTTGTYANSAYTQANTGTTNALAASTYANSAFTTANSAGSYANSAFTAANTAYAAASNSYNFTTAVNLFANGAYDQANSAASYANSAFLAANTADSKAVTSGSYANSAFLHANSAFGVANNAVPKAGGTMTGDLLMTANVVPTVSNTYYLGSVDKVWHSIFVGPGSINIDGITLGNTGGSLAITTASGETSDLTQIYSAANSAGAYANSAFTKSNAAFGQANSAASYANSAFSSANTADSKAVTAGSYANSAYTQANTATTNALAASSYANAAFIQANAVYQYANTLSPEDNVARYTANSAALYANGAFVQANGASIYANGAFVQANAAFTVANNALPLTGGTINGSLTVTQNATINGNLTVLGSTTSVNTSSFTVNDSLLTLGLGNYTSDILDIGFAAHYNDGSNAHTGIIRDAGTKEWLFFEGYTPELTPNNNIIITDPSFAYANVVAKTLKGNVVANNVIVNGYDAFTYITNAYSQANTGVNNAAGASLYANGAFVQANAAYAAANAAGSNATVVAAFLQANSAFDRANNSLNVTTGGIVAGNVTANSFIANTSIYSSKYYSPGGTTNLTLSDIGIVSINSGGQEIKFGASGIEVIGVYGGSFGGNKISLNNETNVISNRYDIVKIQTGTDGTVANEWSFSNNTIIFPDTTVQTTAWTGAAASYANSAFLKANASFGTANSAASYANAAFIQANAVYQYANTLSPQDNVARETANSAALYANGAFVQANSAFTTANNALPKAGGQLSGVVSSSSSIIASALTSNTSVTINTNAAITSNTLTTSSTSQVSVDAFPTTTYRSAKYEVQITSSTDYHVIELRVVHDGTTVTLAQYGEMFTGSSLGTFDSSITTGTVNLLFTPTNSVTTVKLVRTAIVV